MCWVHWYEFISRFANIRGRVSLINNLLQTSYCTLFFVWVLPWGFSYKVFNKAISRQGYAISFIFPTGVLGDNIGDIRCIILFSLCEFSIYGFSYKVFDEAMSTQRYILYHLFFPTGFFKMLFDSYWPYGQGVFRLRLWVLLKVSNNIGNCISWCFSLFFPLSFKEFCLVYRYYFGFSQ